MRARLLRSALLASAVAVLLVGLPLVWVGAVLLLQQGHEELDEHAASVHMVVLVQREQTLEELRPRLDALLRQDNPKLVPPGI